MSESSVTPTPLPVAAPADLNFISSPDPLTTAHAAPKPDGVTHSWDPEATLEVRFARQLGHLNTIGQALSTERDIDLLLEKVLSVSRELTGADAGSLFLVGTREDGEEALFFCEAQNDSVSVSTKVSFTVGNTSLAGYVALTGEPLCFEDVYHIPADMPYQFNPAFDLQNGYRTKSLLVVPLRNRTGKIMGVLQLINRKQRRDTLLTSEAIVHQEVLPFDDESLGLAASIASQAAIALENTRLLASIEELLESFVVASSSAIEDRDPSTSGHSRRVTELTLGLADAINEKEDGVFADLSFSEQALKELRYAGLLHDFGKIGVRESVLTKSHKLEPAQFQVVKMRLALVRQERKFSGEDVGEIDELFRLLARANDPQVTYLPDEEYAALRVGLDKLASLQYEDENGERLPVINETEIAALSIRKGSLTLDEYKQIQEHAALSYDFLSKIAWTEDLAKVPAIARSHHEKLNGKGYPQGITGDKIPLQAKLMTVSDIYDALTAADRPYKKAMPVDRALSILKEEVKWGGLDSDVVDLFIECEIWRLTTSEMPGAGCQV